MYLYSICFVIGLSFFVLFATFAPSWFSIIFAVLGLLFIKVWCDVSTEIEAEELEKENKRRERENRRFL
ncbi:hypothetical protein [Helicobacter cetorum]|uniref:Uncharacterized protein n=1 Tax=Helicobacter cetorum (strain ATCC BAA-429 / MIT 00-7128) TaxID=182217 RepID=I0EMG7_HELC0|nr:hypothetical protein [Helicobacter cetorum]AFI04136.1 hypothetical protein HCW_04335 [Helicobacter cetorum MIT 00-7128]